MSINQDPFSFVNWFKSLPILVKEKIYFFLLLLFYFVLFFYLLPHWSYFLNPDGYSYMFIAKKYAQFKFYDAINAYWGPLFSWVSVIFIWLGYTGITGIKMVNAFTGAFSLYALRILMKRFNILLEVKLLLLFGFIFSSVHHALTIVSSDLILTGCMLMYVGQLCDDSFFSKKKSAVMAGMWGFLMYVSKQYGFYYFLLSYPVVMAVALVKYKKSAVRQLLIGFVVFIALSLIWVLLIHYKYGRFMLGSSGEYNLIYAPPNTVDMPLVQKGLINLPNKYALNAWEDPGLLTDSSQRISKTTAQYAELFINNCMLFLRLTLRLFYYVSFAALILYVVNIFVSKKLPFNEIILVINFILFPVGYFIAFIEPRYIWPNFYLIVVFIGIVLSSKLIQKDLDGLKVFIYLLIFFVVFLPISKFGGRNQDKTIVVGSQQILNNTSKLGFSFDTPENFASNGSYFESSSVAYHLNGKYLGQIKPDSTPEEIEAQLQKYNIKYYLVWVREGYNLYVPKRDGVDLMLNGRAILIKY